jgi:20S proteasome alpha/beta subunit
MTIAIGLRGNEGVVIATDSQETVTGYIKNQRGKTHTIIFANHNAVCFAGSGTSDYIETATEKAIEGLGGLDDLREVQARLESNLLDFFDNHLARWAYFSESERPSVELLIGVSLHSGPYSLFHYSGTSFNSVSSKAIGAGILLANDLLDDYVEVGGTIQQHSAAAIYILSKVKKQVDTCGGFTDLVALKRKGDFALSDSRELETIENQLTKREEELTKAFKKEIIATTVPLSWHSEHRKRKKDAQNA